MIPEFPNFKKLEITDREEIESFTKKFDPYSDFNFISMWSWDIRGEIRLSVLDGNLVVRFTDYLTGEPFYSFLGNNNVNRTAQLILDLAEKEGLSPLLRLLPEDSVKNISMDKFSLKEDINNFDYVYSTSKLTKLEGSEYSNIRRLVKNFDKNERIEIKLLDLNSIQNRMQILKLAYTWKSNKEKDFETENEEEALERLLNSAESLSLLNIGIFINGELVAFTINEASKNKFSISYFTKFNVKFKGSYFYCMQHTSQALLNMGYEYVNCEQDLGLPGLRYSKESLKPVLYFKKYILHRNNL